MAKVRVNVMRADLAPSLMEMNAHLALREPFALVMEIHILVRQDLLKMKKEPQHVTFARPEVSRASQVLKHATFALLEPLTRLAGLICV